MLLCLLLFFFRALPSIRIIKANRVSCSLIFFFYRHSPKEAILLHLLYLRTCCTSCSSLFLLRYHAYEAKLLNIKISPFCLQELCVGEVSFHSKTLFFSSYVSMETPIKTLLGRFPHQFFLTHKAPHTLLYDLKLHGFYFCLASQSILCLTLTWTMMTAGYLG